MGSSEYIKLYNTILSPNKETLELLRINGAPSIDLSYLVTLTKLQHVNMGWNDNISSLSSLLALTNVRYFNMTDTTGITDLSPLKTWYDNGAFHWKNPGDYNNRIEIETLNLDFTPGTANRDIIDYLISKGVKVLYRTGNIVEPLIP